MILSVLRIVFSFKAKANCNHFILLAHFPSNIFTLEERHLHSQTELKAFHPFIHQRDQRAQRESKSFRPTYRTKVDTGKHVKQCWENTAPFPGLGSSPRSSHSTLPTVLCWLSPVLDSAEREFPPNWFDSEFVYLVYLVHNNKLAFIR